MALISGLAEIALVVDEIVEAELFYEEAFDFVTVERRVGERGLADLLGVPDARIRQTIMALDDQRLVLLAFDPGGRGYPPGSTSTDLWFQHFAIVVSDMDEAYARLRAAGRFTPISSDGPVVLPASSGGVSAFKFRDADHHPLELLAYPEGGYPTTWAEKRGDGLFLGIDHSAISVSDTARSIAFLQHGLGLAIGPRSENAGPEQAQLDAVPEARVSVTAMRPAAAPPHIELLGYHVGSRRPVASATTSRDIAASHLVLETEDLPAVVDALERVNAHFVSPGVVMLEEGAEAIMVLDPDGHRFVVRQTLG